MALSKAVGGFPAAPRLDLGELLSQLEAADPALRRQAARDLARHAQAVPGLAHRLQQEADASVRAVIFSSLARIGGPAVVDVLLPLLRSHEPALRNAAIEVLAGLPEAVAPRIEALLVDADSDVRLFGVNLLGQLPHGQVLQWLTRVLDQEPEPNVVGAALDVAAEVAGPELSELLRQVALRFPADPFISFAVGLVLHRMGAA